MKTFSQFLVEVLLIRGLSRTEKRGKKEKFAKKSKHSGSNVENMIQKEHEKNTKEGLTKKVSELGDYDIHKTKFNEAPGNGVAYAAVHRKTGRVHMYVTGKVNTDNKNTRVTSLSLHPDREISAHHLYHHLITHHKIVLQTDQVHTKGGRKTWNKLNQMKDIHVSKENGKPLLRGKRTFNANYQRDKFVKDKIISKSFSPKRHYNSVFVARAKS